MRNNCNYYLFDNTKCEWTRENTHANKIAATAVTTKGIKTEHARERKRRRERNRRKK